MDRKGAVLEIVQLTKFFILLANGICSKWNLTLIMTLGKNIWEFEKQICKQILASGVVANVQDCDILVSEFKLQ